MPCKSGELCSKPLSHGREGLDAVWLGVQGLFITYYTSFRVCLVDIANKHFVSLFISCKRILIVSVYFMLVGITLTTIHLCTE